jgi:hypothetical protein
MYCIIGTHPQLTDGDGVICLAGPFEHQADADRAARHVLLYQRAVDDFQRMDPAAWSITLAALASEVGVQYGVYNQALNEFADLGCRLPSRDDMPPFLWLVVGGVAMRIREHPELLDNVREVAPPSLARSPFDDDKLTAILREQEG